MCLAVLTNIEHVSGSIMNCVPFLPYKDNSFHKCVGPLAVVAAVQQQAELCADQPAALPPDAMEHVQQQITFFST
jgi:hypothetical protein